MTLQKYKFLLVSLKNSILIIQLNRPEKRNALNPELVKELITAFDFAEKDKSIEVIILKGNDQAFCSGADLAYLKNMRDYDYTENLNDSLKLSELFLKIYTLPKPVIAQVEGPALAGGCGLASVCDFILASEMARFGYPEVKIGFIAALVSAFLIRQVGERKARELLLTGKIVSAQEAKNFGLINEVYKAHKLNDAVEQLAKELSNNSSQALAATKASLLAEFEFASITEDMKRLAKVNADFRSMDDFIEGITAFIEKRKPKWHDH